MGPDSGADLPNLLPTQIAALTGLLEDQEEQVGTRVAAAGVLGLAKGTLNDPGVDRALDAVIDAAEANPVLTDWVQRIIRVRFLARRTDK